MLIRSYKALLVVTSPLMWSCPATIEVLMSGPTSSTELGLHPTLSALTLFDRCSVAQMIVAPVVDEFFLVIDIIKYMYFI
jgi:hypothetical protein